MRAIAINLQVVRQGIRDAARPVGRGPASVQLLAMSKPLPFVRLRGATGASQGVFGGSYAQEALGLSLIHI